MIKMMQREVLALMAGWTDETRRDIVAVWFV